MYKYSKRSLDRLKTCHHKLQDIFMEVIKEVDITIIEGHRTLKKQEEYVEKGVSKTMKSNHRYDPSRAVDVAPYPIDWNDKKRFDDLAVIVKRIANEKNIKIRWGGDFKSFYDGPHYELLKEEV